MNINHPSINDGLHPLHGEANPLIAVRNPLQRAAHTISSSFKWIGRQFISIGIVFISLFGRARHIPQADPRVPEANPLQDEIRDVAEEVGDYAAHRVEDVLREQADHVQQMAEEYLFGHRVEGEEAGAEAEIVDDGNGLDETLSHWPRLPNNEEKPLSRQAAKYLKNSFSTMVRQESQVYQGPKPFLGPFAELPEGTTLESVIEAVMQANETQLSAEDPIITSHRRLYLRDMIQNLYGDGPLERWKEAMEEVTEVIAGDEDQSLVPQVRVYLNRIAAEMIKFNPGDDISMPPVVRVPPIYYGHELALAEGQTEEQVMERVIEICSSYHIQILWDGQEEKQVAYLTQAIGNLFGHGRVRPEPDLRYREAAADLATAMTDSLGDTIILPEEREMVLTPENYLRQAMEHFLSDRITPPLLRGEKANLTIPAPFNGNKEAYYQSLVQNWMERLPEEYRQSGQVSTTHKYLYRSLEQLFGTTNSEDKQALRQVTATALKEQFILATTGELVVTPVDYDDIKNIRTFCNHIADNVAGHLHEGRDLEPLPFIGKPLRFVERTWGDAFYSGPTGWFQSATNVITDHSRDTLIIEDRALKIFNTVKEGAGHLSPVQQSDLLQYIKVHLYQAYGEDNRANWGQGSEQSRNRAKLLKTVIKDIPKHYPKGSPERKVMINESTKFLKQMMEQVALMPLGHSPELPKRVGPALPLDADGITDPDNKEFAGVWNQYRQNAIDKMVDNMMTDLGNHYGKDQTRGYIKLCLAELYGIKLAPSTMDVLKEAFTKPLLGWGISQVADIKEPLIKAAVEDTRQNAAGLVAKVGRELSLDLHRIEEEAREDGAPLVKSLVEQNVIPGLIQSLDTAIDERRLGIIHGLEDRELPSEELAARREYISELIMQIIFPNGPQDIPALQPGNLEAIPEAANIIGLLQNIERLNNPDTREVLGYLFGAERVDLNLDKALRSVCSLADEELQELEEEGIHLTEGIRAAAEVIRKGGEKSHTRAYQVLLYTVIQRTIDGKVLEEVLQKTTDPRIQRQRMLNFANDFLNYLRSDEEEEVAAPEATGGRPNTIKGSVYHVIGEQLFDLFVAHHNPNTVTRSIGKKIISKQVGKLTAVIFDHLTVTDLLKPSLEGATDWLQEQTGKKAATPSAWWWPEPPSEEITTEELEEQFTAAVRVIKDELINQWRSKGMLHDVAGGFGLRVASRMLHTDPELNGLIENLVRNTILVTDQVATKDMVLTLTERTLEDLKARRETV